MPKLLFGVSNPLWANEFRRVLATFQTLAHNVCFIVFSAQDTFMKFIFKIEILAPYRQDILLAYLPANLV